MNLMYSPHGYAHLALQFSRPKRLIYQTIERLLAVGPCTTVGCGSAEDKEAKRLGASHVLIRNAVSPVQESRNKKSSKDPVTIACLGRTSPQKNPAMFDSVAFKVFSKLKTIEQAPEVNFLWIGGGTPEFPWTTAVETGWQDHQSAIRLLAENADIYFSTAVFEGLPLAVLEAMSLGLPLVLSDIPGHRDCVAPSGENGVLFDSENMAVTALLNYCLSTKARAEASTNSLAWYSKNFELSKMLAQYRLLYQQVALTGYSD